MPEGFVRPREKDLIYFELNNKVFQIFYVDNKPTFYPLGQLPMYKLTCELFEASSERFTTGVPGIDRLNFASRDMYSWGIRMFMVFLILIRLEMSCLSIPTPSPLTIMRRIIRN